MKYIYTRYSALGKVGGLTLIFEEEEWEEEEEEEEEEW